MVGEPRSGAQEFWARAPLFTRVPIQRTVPMGRLPPIYFAIHFVGRRIGPGGSGGTLLFVWTHHDVFFVSGDPRGTFGLVETHTVVDLVHLIVFDLS